MPELFVYQRGTGFIGEISDYDTIQEERNYYEVSKLLVRVIPDDKNIELLRLGNILFLSSNLNYPYIIDHFSIIKEGKREIIEAYCFSLNHILSYRTVLRQEFRTGNIEDVVKGFINNNAIQSSDSSRNIDQLVLGPNTGLTDTIRVSRTGGDLLSTSMDIMREFEGTIDIIYNATNNNFEVVTHRSPDRSILQNINNHVIFSTEYDNLLNRNYYIDRLNYKNVAIVAGEGEGLSRSLEVVGNSSGWDRRENYVDARDLQRQSLDDQGNTITLTELEYADSLINRGIQSNNETSVIESFEATIDRQQFIVGVDFGIGDKITFEDTQIGVIQNLRVTQIITTHNTNGTTIIPSFGSNLQNNLLR